MQFATTLGETAPAGSQVQSAAVSTSTATTVQSPAAVPGYGFGLQLWTSPLNALKALPDIGQMFTVSPTLALGYLTPLLALAGGAVYLTQKKSR